MIRFTTFIPQETVKNYKISAVPCDHPYVALMVAWYFATALAKQWDAGIPYLKDRKLPPAVHRKTIQKAVESFRIAEDRKRYLKTLRDERGTFLKHSFSNCII